MNLRAQTCCFTGHRILSAHEKARIPAKLDSILLPLIEQEIRVFWLGGALGFDTLAAEHLLKLRSR